MYDTAPPTPAGSLMVTAKVKNAFLRASGAKGDEELVEDIVKEIDVVGPGGKRLSAIGEDCPV